MSATCCHSKWRPHVARAWFSLSWKLAQLFLETIVQAKENMPLESLWPDSNPLHTITNTFENIYCKNSWKLILLNEENTMKCESESEVAQSSPILCDPMDFSLPGSSVHGIFQAVVLEWIAISFSRESSLLRDQTQVSCIAGRLLTIWAIREVAIKYT